MAQGKASSDRTMAVSPRAAHVVDAPTVSASVRQFGFWSAIAMVSTYLVFLVSGVGTPLIRRRMWPELERDIRTIKAKLEGGPSDATVS
jgi:thiosulfate reductase cytochrome b subunit